jgi:phosphohistidine swiveling domain-containing protein
VSAILARAEDDDDLLLQAYHLWHRAIRRIASAAGDSSLHGTTVLLDLLPADLMRWTQSFDPAVLREGLARGRALAHAWNAWSPPSSGSSRTDRLTGTPAAPGRAEGRVQRALHLEEIEDAEGTVAVVATVSPSDAVHVPGLVALVCEGGDVLGHASVLARESGVPCVVGAGQARLRLGHAERLLVDGDRGEIVVTATRS